MTVRAPIVLIDGKLVELPSGDVIGGAPAGVDGVDAIDGNDGGAITIGYSFSTTTTDADPGSGSLRLNNATQNTATKIYADVLDALGSDWTSVIDTFDDSTNTVKGSIRLVKSGDATKFLTFNVTAVTSASGYRKITVSNTGSSTASPFSNGDSILLCFDRAGDKGTDGADGSGDLVKIAQVITSSSATTISFSSIPNTYTNLELWVTARDVINSAIPNWFLKINGDGTSGNYSTAQVVQTSGGTSAATQVSSTANGMFAGNLPGVSGNADAVISIVVKIPNYANTTFHKPVLIAFTELDSAGPTQRTGSIGAVWKSTSAINALVLTTLGTNFVNGSIATLYGLK